MSLSVMVFSNWSEVMSIVAMVHSWLPRRQRLMVDGVLARCNGRRRPTIPGRLLDGHHPAHRDGDLVRSSSGRPMGEEFQRRIDSGLLRGGQVERREEELGVLRAGDRVAVTLPGVLDPAQTGGLQRPGEA